MNGAFVQIDLAIDEALQRGDIDHYEHRLAFLIACRASYFTRRYTETLSGINAALGWGCDTATTARRLKTLRAQRFIDFDVRRGQRKPYTVTVLSRLVVARKGRDLDTT